MSLVLFAAALAGGVHPAWIAIAAVAVVRPWWFLAACACWGVASRIRHRDEGGPGAEAVFLGAVASELRGGASLRRGLIDAAGRAPGLLSGTVVRRASAGRPMAEIAHGLALGLPHNGRLAAAAVRIAGTTGAAASGAFAALAARSIEAAELARERRVLTAQARLSAVVVGLVPPAFTVLLLATRADEYAAAGAVGWTLVAAGISLETVGLLTVWTMIRRAER